MKFSKLPELKQELVKAYVNGQTIQYKDSFESNVWHDTSDTLYIISTSHPDVLRVKPKEPVVTCLYTGVDNYGGTQYNFDADNIDDINNYYEDTEFVGYLKKTYQDGKFVSVEFIRNLF